MKKTLTHLLPLLGMLWLCSMAEAQTRVAVNFIDGTSRNYIIPSSEGIYFSFSATDTLMRFQTTSGIQSFSVDMVRSIAFSDNNAISQASLDSKQLVLYPNPAKDYIVIGGEPAEQQPVTIYSATGVVVTQGQYSFGEKIDISGLKRGFYVVKIGANALKMYKL